MVKTNTCQFLAVRSERRRSSVIFDGIDRSQPRRGNGRPLAWTSRDNGCCLGDSVVGAACDLTCVSGRPHITSGFTIPSHNGRPSRSALARLFPGVCPQPHVNTRIFTLARLRKLFARVNFCGIGRKWVPEVPTRILLPEEKPRGFWPWYLRGRKALKENVPFYVRVSGLGLSTGIRRNC